jgi:hypothetical protein
VGAVPDLGAVRAAQLLAERFGLDVDPDVLVALNRVGAIPVAGEYKDWPLYNGRALERFDDRAVLERAIRTGRLLGGDAPRRICGSAGATSST